MHEFLISEGYIIIRDSLIFSSCHQTLTMVILYHYTDKAGYQAIQKTGKILMSSATGGDAIAGDGVYLTSLSPQNRSKMMISENNYDGAQMMFAERQEEDGKVDYWFEFNLPESAVRKYPAKRDIWLYPAQDLLFSDYRPTDHGDFNSYGAQQPTKIELEVLKDLLGLSIGAFSAGLIPWMLIMEQLIMKQLQ